MILASTWKNGNQIRTHIPRDICAALGLKGGERILFTLTAPGQVVILNANAMLQEQLSQRVKA